MYCVHLLLCECVLEKQVYSILPCVCVQCDVCMCTCTIQFQLVCVVCGSVVVYSSVGD